MSSAPADFSAPSGTALRMRVRATIAAVAFLPASALTGFLTLFSDRASRCVVQGGESCVGMPGWVWLLSAVAAGVLWVIALVTPDRGARTDAVRGGALRAQLCFEALALCAILSHA
ncbi:hypothetical protein ACFT5C_11265 [Streptomyces sp. NPDC057116]|uniref:hypothetical protein n=1 Tax=Streptomyces sp. NPDC057116 TaxID=3346023 RepID=UPI0036258763